VIPTPPRGAACKRTASRGSSFRIGEGDRTGLLRERDVEPLFRALDTCCCCDTERADRGGVLIPRPSLVADPTEGRGSNPSPCRAAVDGLAERSNACAASDGKCWE